MPKATSPPSRSAALALEFTEGRQTAAVAAPDGPAAVTAAAGGGRGPVAPVVTAAGGGGRGVAQAFAACFLPEGFPHSVSSDYLPYQLWDSIQGLSSYLRGMLSSQAMLAGVGFFLKDFTGMLGGILFASTQGSGLDCYAKQWRLLADVMNDIGLALELASPLLPGAFLLLACLGSLARAVTGVAGSATRMALTQHFALQRNAADIAAKEGSQETAVTLVGMVLGMAFIRAAHGLEPLIWSAFWALTALHVWANVRAMRCLRIASLNQARLGLLLRHYLRTGEALTPGQMAAEESLVPPPLQLLLRRLGLGFGGVPLVAVAPRLATLRPAMQQQLAARMQAAAEEEDKRRRRGGAAQYVAAAAPGGGGAGAGPDAVALLRQGAGMGDVLEAYCASLMLAWGAQLSGRGPSKLWPAPAQLALADVERWLAAAAAAAAAGRGRGAAPGPGGGSYEGFLASLAAAGWALDRVALLQGPSRLAWGADLRTD
ncbi:hypothetical protein CHLNCDRAFT_135084 [Chlorella variabilis]|uniref:Protein root UVB sensitive/RUS domain-containing protein n=1 Tax=Chlorella variabilis TaxID=554065 RepID=E1ZHH1_CHLVA|nr:hypothetical protein CHLNCDRAFT_135084 [Chlorella variabilis]EFN54602.1 hypothetical protein CHLNCDRAFT_135084 [Chlorella variabilis]|eukprot:XP_005846704.1 hypothetical protein CHLNCDRAFT_135084 [Chlorella variabilis]